VQAAFTIFIKPTDALHEKASPLGVKSVSNSPITWGPLLGKMPPFE